MHVALRPRRPHEIPPLDPDPGAVGTSDAERDHGQVYVYNLPLRFSVLAWNSATLFFPVLVSA
jgi:hypothetical protein